MSSSRPERNNLFRLDGKVAVITGSTRGIGRAIAEGFAGAGAEVVVNGRAPEGVAKVAEAIRDEGGRAHEAPGDVGTSAGVNALFSAAVLACGRVDVLVNNASISSLYKRAEEITDEEWDLHLDTNLTSAFRCSRALGRHLKERGSGGCIVNISSVGGSVALPRVLPYCVSKGGLDQMTRVLAVEWAQYGIRVNAIAPAYVDTDMTRGLLQHPRYGPELLSRTPMGRFASPEEIVGAAVFLASDAASYVTGSILAVDGGWGAL